MQFLFRWQHLTPDTQVRGRAGLISILEQLQGYEVPAGSWEAVLASRVANYQPTWLDELCLGGEVVWGRLSPPADSRCDQGIGRDLLQVPAGRSRAR